jgi:hypothetical protein
MKLNAAQRRKLPKSDFALPQKLNKGPSGKKMTKGAYPIPDESHARNALSRVSANGTPAQKKEVRAKVHAKYPDIGKMSDSDFKKHKANLLK